MGRGGILDMEVQEMLQLGELSLAQQGAGREPQL